MAEICNECGCNVRPGSGKFINRVPDFNSYADRLMNDKPFPDGDFMCEECDNKIRTEEE